jgi:hypothetical protein
MVKNALQLIPGESKAVSFSGARVERLHDCGQIWPPPRAVITGGGSGSSLQYG